ncbi:hypothetical protein WP50_03770, partial [Lactiplantibacillus plantarum]
RAMRTAELILPASGNTDLTVQPMAAFREAFYGYFEGDDTSQTWFMVGAPHQAPSLSAIIWYSAILMPNVTTSLLKPPKHTVYGGSSFGLKTAMCSTNMKMNSEN